MSKDFDSFKVYVINCYNDNESFIKIGRTYKSVNKRFNGKLLPYNYTVINEVQFSNPYDCCVFEQQLKNKLKFKKYSPLLKFGGDTECFELTEG